MSIELRNKTDISKRRIRELILSNISAFKNADNDFINFPHLHLSNSNCFMMRVKGDSMINAGISSGDSIIADKSDKEYHNKIVVAEIDNKITLKRYCKSGNSIMLCPENPMYSQIKIAQNMKLKIWGVAKKVIKNCI